MPRNGSGTYAIPTTFVAGTTISAPATNANNTDIGAELTNSLSRDGQSTMTGQFKAASGTVGAPGIAFSSDTDSGFYRIGADNIGGAVAGAKVLDISATGFGVTGDLSSTGAITKNGVAVEAFASGTAMIFVQTSAPTGWTKQTGTDNAALRLVSGSVGSGGTANFTTALASRTITQGNLPSYNLQFTNTQFMTSTTTPTQGSASGSGGGPTFVLSVTDNKSGVTQNVPSGGSGTAMDFAVKYKDVIHGTKD